MSNKPIHYCWKLEKYARHTAKSASEYADPEQGKDDQNWEIFDGDPKELTLTLTKTLHLLVTHGDTIQENYSLWNSREWMRGISKGDSMLFIIKHQGSACRRFRVKFASNSMQSCFNECQRCAEILEVHFPIKKVPIPDSSGSKNLASGGAPFTLKGTAAVSKVAEVMCGQVKEGSLPLLYPTIDFPEKDLSDFVRLCLTDSNFPQFVGRVEAEIEKITKEVPPSG